MATITNTTTNAVHMPAASRNALQATDTSGDKVQQSGQDVQLQMIPSPPVFANKFEEREYLKGRLALAFRLFGQLGFDEGVAGHITLRDPVRPDHFWVNPLGRAFRQMRRSDLILVNGQGDVVDGGANRLLNGAAYMIHHAVHAARPDVRCAAHAHSLFGRAFCALGKPLDMLTQDSCAFYKSAAVYNQFNGVVLARDEGANIARALGAGKACLLQNHGLLTVGATVEAAVFWFASLEKCCRVQLLADAAGPTKKIDEADAEFTFRSVGTPGVGWFSAQPMFDVLEEEIGDVYLQ
ncbi:class II aldolase/adducin domain protein [Niveomyces insectorum RCEF 264]|uniref:Class II aldolase/adducin domain protein n=1 Tax=Niveomyces insectorum RCEF 264 TaxID=1081102 RepID=A0A167QUG5_9HYPO|nr:class II aldolase/adducin domain protein [Niveomyces insectorum RCEF 264]